MVLEAIYGPEACPPPATAGDAVAAVAARVDLQLPEGSLLAAVVAAAASGDDDDLERAGAEPSPCHLEFFCPRECGGEASSVYPAAPPLVAISCAALPASCLRRMTRRLARIAVAAAAVDQPMLHDLVSAASEMLAGDWHLQPGGDGEQQRLPLEDSSDEEGVGAGNGQDEDGDEDWEREEAEEVDGKGEEEEEDDEAEAAAAAASQVAAGDLQQQQQEPGQGGPAEGGDEAEGDVSLVEDFDGLALGGEDESDADDAAAREAVSAAAGPGAKQSALDKAQPKGGPPKPVEGQQRPGGKQGGRPARAALSAAAAQAEGSKLTSHQAWIEGAPEHAGMRQQRAALPAFSQRAELLGLLAQNPVVVISGATGCGKSTQVPQYILEEAIAHGQGARCNIIVTQPRRISALGLAARVAAERGEDVGQTVGYSVRLDSKQSVRTRLLFCTTGGPDQFQRIGNQTSLKPLQIRDICCKICSLIRP